MREVRIAVKSADKPESSNSVPGTGFTFCGRIMAEEQEFSV
jgi:hypothetical protein